MTYNQALEAGYKRAGTTLQRGYVKRTAPYLSYYDQELIPAGRDSFMSCSRASTQANIVNDTI